MADRPKSKSAVPKFMGYCKPEHLAFGHRAPKMLSEMNHYDPDIICLQEVDNQIYPFLHSRMSLYDSKWTMKTGGKLDGCAVFWKKESWCLCDIVELQFGKCHTMLTDNIAQIVTLQHLEEDIKLIVANTHFFWDPKYPKVRSEQAKKLATALYPYRNLPLLISGDFNSNKSSPVFRGFTQVFELASTYSADNLDEYSCYPRSQDNADVIDHIFFSQPNLTLLNRAPLPVWKSEKHVIPSHDFPSDHISLVATFQLKPPQEEKEKKTTTGNKN